MNVTAAIAILRLLVDVAGLAKKALNNEPVSVAEIETAQQAVNRASMRWDAAAGQDRPG